MVAALLNITEDHLNRHGSMEQYTRLKQRIFENQTAQDVAVLNMDDPALLRMAEKLKPRVAFFSRTQRVENGACVEAGKIVWRWDGETRPICDANQVLIPGPHNLENALAAHGDGRVARRARRRDTAHAAILCRRRNIALRKCA